MFALRPKYPRFSIFSLMLRTTRPFHHENLPTAPQVHSSFPSFPSALINILVFFPSPCVGEGAHWVKVTTYFHLGRWPNSTSWLPGLWNQWTLGYDVNWRCRWASSLDMVVMVKFSLLCSIQDPEGRIRKASKEQGRSHDPICDGSSNGSDGNKYSSWD